MQKTLSFHAKLHELESSLGNQDIGEKVKKNPRLNFSIIWLNGAEEDCVFEKDEDLVGYSP